MSETPAPRPSRYRFWLFLLPVVAVVVPVAAFEIGLRFFVQPSPYSSGRLHGRELPPLKVVPFDHSMRPDAAQPIEGLVVDAKRITRGDLFGFLKEDPEIGYVWEPARRSANGWWESNALGARSRTATPRTVPGGLRRVAVFGDSFAAGTRVPQELTWPARLQALRPDLDVVNFGVDGYGMGQSLLLDRRMRAKIDYGIALYLFVPWHDPWRDVNVIRYLGEGWGSYTPMPRLVPDGEGLKLVPPYYARGTEVYDDDYLRLSPGLRDHLRAYDRFYIPSLYEATPVLSHLMLWNLIAARRGEDERRRVREEMGGRLDREAFEVTRRILKVARHEATESGRRVVVAVLPVQSDLAQLAKDPAARERWKGIVEGIRALGAQTIDLAPALSQATPDRIDEGYDGTHYGPNASEVIAEALARELK